MTARPDDVLTLRNLARGNARAAVSTTFAPFWWDAAPRRENAGGPLPKAADVVIVGSGFTGLSAAITLLKKGRSVVVLDRGVPGFGASTRNGGQIGSGNQKFRVKRLIELRGEKKAVEMLREGTRMLDYIEHLIQSEKIDCHFVRCGRFRAAVRPEHYDAMARDMDDLKRAAGVESFMVPRAEQLSEIGSEKFFGGSVLPNDASLQPALYHAGLMARIEQLGGIIIGHTRALQITADGSRFLVSTAAGPITAGNVLIATNGYTDGLVAELKPRIVPIGSALITTDKLSQGLLSKLLPHNRVYGNTKRVFSYFRAAPGENRIVWGGRIGHAGSATSPRAYRHLARELLDVFPELADTGVTHAWDGQIGYTYDEVPHLGRASTGVHFAIGYCGTGVSRATYFGHKIALQMAGDPDGRTAFDGLAFPAYPAHPVAKRAVPVVETWYRLRDVTGL